MLMINGAFRGIAAGAPQSGGGGLKLLTISGTTDSTHVQWNMSSTYLGAMRLQAGSFPTSQNTVRTADWPVIAKGQSSTKLLISGWHTGAGAEFEQFAEFNIPTLVNSSTLTDLNIGSNSQNFVNAVDSAPSNNGIWGTNGARITGLCTINGKVVVNVMGIYDSSITVTQCTTVINDVTALSTTSQRGFFTKTEPAHVAGWISPIPAAYQDDFGGDYIFGASAGNSRSINSRHSNGPSLFVMDSAAAGSIVGGSPPSNGTAITLTQIMDYPLAHTLGDSAPGGYWNQLCEAVFGIILPNTRTYLVLGFGGGFVGGIHYQGGGDGYSPINSDDFYNYYWLFDVDDILALANPWDAVPYEHGSLDFPFDGAPGEATLKQMGGAFFDPSNSRLYISITGADTTQGTVTTGPIVIGYDLSGITA